MESKRLKKKNGDIVSDLAIPLITLIIIGVLLTTFLTATKENKRIDDLDRIGRQYMLHMETDGYLTEVNKKEVINKLGSLGANNISLSGTTMSSVNYGSEINLMISCNIEVETLKIEGLKVKREKEIVRYSDTWTSTAKN